MKLNFIKNKDFERCQDDASIQNYIQLTDSKLQELLSKKLKKITGSRLSAILGRNNFRSQFQEWALMTGFVKDISEERTAMDAGTIIEQYITKVTNEKFLKPIIKAILKKENYPNLELNDPNHPLGLSKDQIVFLNNRKKDKIQKIADRLSIDVNDIDLSFKNVFFRNVDEFVKDPNNQTLFFDFFPDKGVFGGIPDGIIPLFKKDGSLLKDELGRIIHDPRLPFLECKTTTFDKFKYLQDKNVNGLVLQKDENNAPILKAGGENGNITSWFPNVLYPNGLPSDNLKSQDGMTIKQNYMDQVNLYGVLLDVDEAVLSMCFLTKDDYQNPENFNPDDHSFYFKFLDIDKQQTLADMAAAEKWYKDHILTGKSPNLLSKSSFNNDSLWLDNATAIQVKDLFADRFLKILNDGNVLPKVIEILNTLPITYQYNEDKTINKVDIDLNAISVFELNSKFNAIEAEINENQLKNKTFKNTL